MIDLAAGLLLLLLNVPGEIMLYLGIIMLLKGVYSVLAGAAAGFYFDFPGMFDAAAGILMMVATTGFFLEFFIYIGLIVLIKGAYSIIISFMGQH